MDDILPGFGFLLFIESSHKIVMLVQNQEKRCSIIKRISAKINVFTLSVVALLVLVSGAFFLPNIFGKTATQSINSTDLKILKSAVTKTARFYQYKAGSTYMEVLAVKANDGTIRTALNTCQVCFNSGRGYYLQEGDELVCQNCGNRFNINDVEVVRGGCNPVPILKENKVDDGQNIVIPGGFLRKNKSLFSRWKK